MINFRFEVVPKSNQRVRQLCWCRDGVWISIRDDHTLRLFNAFTYEPMQTVDVAYIINESIGKFPLNVSVMEPFAFTSDSVAHCKMVFTALDLVKGKYSGAVFMRNPHSITPLTDPVVHSLHWVYIDEHHRSRNSVLSSVHINFSLTLIRLVLIVWSV